MNRLTDADLNYVPEPPFFVPLGAPVLSDLDNETANYDLDVLSFASSLASEPNDGGAMDSFLADMAFNPGDFQAQNFDQVNADWGNMQSGYEAQLVDNESGLGSDPSPGSPAPQPSPGPNPPAGGGPQQPPVAHACTSADFPGLKVDQMRTLNPMTLNAPQPDLIYLESNTWQTQAQLVQGDPSVWELRLQVDRSQGVTLYQVILFAHASKTGHFAAAVRLQSQYYVVPRVFGFCVDIG